MEIKFEEITSFEELKFVTGFIQASMTDDVKKMTIAIEYHTERKVE